jgi:hypothetical protein
MNNCRVLVNTITFNALGKRVFFTNVGTTTEKKNKNQVAAAINNVRSSCLFLTQGGVEGGPDG